ncbi:MAG: TlpA family protein disulfide reductase, partial [Anaerolineae bacterium]
VAGRIDTPRLGQTPPTTDTPKLTDGAALADLTSDPDPDEALYQMTVGEAIESGKPTLVLFASPGHCANEDCAATLAAVRRIARQKAGELNVIHIESRDLADPTQMSATAKAWGLPSEPWTFLFDNRGFLVARVEGPVEQVELGLLIDQMVKQ